MTSSSSCPPSAPTRNDFQAVLPPEIWLNIFPYLKPGDLQSASLTCSTFRYMAQPLLFSVLNVSPFFLSYNADRPIKRPTVYLERFLERLAYYQLPHLKHAVRHCWISPYSRHGFPERNPTDDLDPSLIISPLVAALPGFPNLRVLSWHCIDITAEWWDIIHSLRLTKLWINSSDILSCKLPTDSITHIELDQWPWEGKVTNHVSIHEERSAGTSLSTLHRIIDAEGTEIISVPRVDTACRLLSGLRETTHYVKTLKIPFAALRSADFIPALELCPRLEVLCIFPPSSDERSRDIKLELVPPTAVPSLTTYDGPCTHLMDFSCKSLQRITLWGFDERPILADPAVLVDVFLRLSETGSVHTIKSIQIAVKNITHDLMGAISPFYSLESLAIQSQDSSKSKISMPYPLQSNSPITVRNLARVLKFTYPEQVLYDILASANIPPHLRYLKVDTRLSSMSTDLEVQERETANFIEAFASHHPAITKLELTYGVYWTGIYSAVWGRLRNNDAPLSTPSEELAGIMELCGGGYSSKSSSRHCLMSTVVSTVHPLPLGKLTFSLNRRTILFPNGGKSGGLLGSSGSGIFEGELTNEQREVERSSWMAFFCRLKKMFGRNGV